MDRFKESLLKFKDRYYSFKKTNDIQQCELDKYISSSKEFSEVGGNNPDLEKGLNKYTYRTIWQQIVQMGEDYTTPEELGEILGIARVTCRKYLEYMNKEEKLEKLIEYGKVGRPQHKYKINN